MEAPGESDGRSESAPRSRSSPRTEDVADAAVDNSGSSLLLRGVQFARRLAALLLLVLWLPALLHCPLEAAGLTLTSTCCVDDHSAEASDGCTRDGCETLESGFTKPPADGAVAPAPVLCACLQSRLCVPTPVAPVLPPVDGVTTAATAPPETIRSLPFLTRTAPPSRAPALAS